MLADWFRKEQIREARDQGIEIGIRRSSAQTLELVLEAENQRREGETLAQAIARLQAERENLR